MASTEPFDGTVVIGAGLAGLAAALQLHAAGVPVRLYEAGDRPGGALRTAVIDGFRLDRGFQVHNTAYPEPARLLDVPDLRLGYFVRGATLVRPGRVVTLVDPREEPSAAGHLLTGLPGGAADRLAFARLAARVYVTPAARLLREPEVSTRDYLAARGVSTRAVSAFLGPFLRGVFLERELLTSSRFFLLVFRCFLRGRTALPAAGIEAIPAQLAARLPPGTIRVGERLDALPRNARAVIVATDATAAHRLLPELGPAPTMTSMTTYYHRTPHDPGTGRTLLLDSTGETAIVNTVVLSAAVPSYAPPDQHLISTSILGDAIEEPSLRKQLRRFYGSVSATFEPIDVVRIPGATPLQPPPLGTLRKPVRLRAGVYVAGAHRDTASTQGALVSGRRAARAVLADLRMSPAQVSA